MSRMRAALAQDRIPAVLCQSLLYIEGESMRLLGWSFQSACSKGYGVAWCSKYSPWLRYEYQTDPSLTRIVRWQNRNWRLENTQYFFKSFKSAITLSGEVCRSWISCGMKYVWGRIPPARDVELSAYNRFAQTDDNTLLPSRLSSGSDCWILATLTCNLIHDANDFSIRFQYT